MAHSHLPITSHGQYKHLPHFHVLGPDETAVISGCEGAVVDFDGTVVNSYDFHDGTRGRFSVGLQMALQRSGISRDVIAFVRKNWESEFAHFAGRAEAEVVRMGFERVVTFLLDTDRGELARDLFTLDKVEKFGRWFVDAVIEKPEVAKKLCPLVDGIDQLLARGTDVGMRHILCSASGASFVRGFVKAHGLEREFPQGVYSASKQLPNGDYSGTPVVEALRLLKTPRSQTVMYGDSKGDIGSAIMAGLPLIAIRVREFDNLDVRASYAQQFALMTAGLETPPDLLLTPSWNKIQHARQAGLCGSGMGLEIR